jgi:hypothetical protein
MRVEPVEISVSPPPEPVQFRAGVTKRIILPVCKYLLGMAHIDQAIPTPKNKQLVLHKCELSPDQERLWRMCFWYGEDLLGGLETESMLQVRWSTARRTGHVSMRLLHLTGHTLPTVKLPELSVRLASRPRGILGRAQPGRQQPAHYACASGGADATEHEPDE